MTNANNNISQLDTSLSDKWKSRFDFFEKYGVPGLGAPSPEFQAALKQLHWKDRLKVAINFYAFFFSFIYLFVLGLWRQAIMLIGAALALGVIGGILGLPDSVMNGIGFGLTMLCGLRANALYYQKKVQGREDWRL